MEATTSTGVISATIVTICSWPLQVDPEMSLPLWLAVDSRLRGRELSVAVVVRFAFYGVGKLQGGPRGVHAQALALDQPMAVADLYDLRQRQVGPELSVLRP